MTTAVLDIISGAFIAAGAFFFVVGALGIYRMPDVFTRMHAGGISDTVGAGLLLIGMMFTAGPTLVTAKLAIILVVIWFTGPIATHALAQAALHAGVKPRLASEKVMTGPGVREKPGEAKHSVRKSKSTAAERRPVADAAKHHEKTGRSGKGRKT